MRIYLLFILLYFQSTASAAADTSYLKHLYDRCLEFDESKSDSICYYATFIEKESHKIKFYKGPVLSLRLKGLCNEFKSDYEKAIDFYLQSLDESRKINEVAYEVSALSDLAIVYANIGQPAMAKKFYIQCAALALQSKEIYTVVSSYNNLGVIYTQLGEYDSALVFLNKALEIGKEGGDRLDNSGTYNNIGNAYFRKKQFEKALQYFMLNFNNHKNNPEDFSTLWTDHINLADTYLSLKKFDSSEYHANKAMELVADLKSKSKEADSYSMLARLFSQKGKYEKAYEYLTKWYTLDTGLVNGNTQSTIAELQERFNAKERENENKLLLVEVEQERYRNRSVSFIAVAFAVVCVVIAIAFINKRKSNEILRKNNEMIGKQNDRLAELNQEKNSLIGIVSHDLASPFATIHTWSQILSADKNTLNEDQQKAIQRISQSVAHGQQLIKNVLDIERADIIRNKIVLEQFNLSKFISELIESFKPAADKKQIQLIASLPQAGVFIMSDKQLVHRVIENLLSNAIKYSPIKKRVWINLLSQSETVTIEIKDEGVGIDEEELPLLFSKYSKISSQPTAGEPSTGLGLSIVKRILEELNGSISCESKIDEGSSFTVTLKK